MNRTENVVTFNGTLLHFEVTGSGKMAITQVDRQLCETAFVAARTDFERTLRRWAKRHQIALGDWNISHGTRTCCSTGMSEDRRLRLRGSGTLRRSTT